MNPFRTSREFEASPLAVFAALEDPQRLARWWGPEGFSNRFEVFEFVPGGRWVFDMVGPDAQVYPNACVFEHIAPGQALHIAHVCAPFFKLHITLTPTPGGTRLDWVQTFADEAVAQAVAHIVEPANAQNLNRLAQELGLVIEAASKEAAP